MVNSAASGSRLCCQKWSMASVEEVDGIDGAARKVRRYRCNTGEGGSTMIINVMFGMEEGEE